MLYSIIPLFLAPLWHMCGTFGSKGISHKGFLEMESRTKNARINFTLTSVRALPIPTEGRAVYHDTKVPGLSLRITSNGTISFFVRARFQGNQDAPRITLG